MDTLTAIFGSETKVKILRLFLFNDSTPFFLREITSRTQSSPQHVKKELRNLENANILVRRRRISKEIVKIGPSQKATAKRVQGSGYALNAKFPYLDPFKNLLTITSLRADESLARRFTNAGRIKLFIASGVFIQNWDSRVDLLIVGDELNLAKIESVIKSIEAEIGKEIAYSAFETQDFEYRVGIHDRLVRDILDYPHVTLLDRLGMEPQ